MNTQDIERFSFVRSLGLPLLTLLQHLPGNRAGALTRWATCSVGSGYLISAGGMLPGPLPNAGADGGTAQGSRLAGYGIG